MDQEQLERDQLQGRVFGHICQAVGGVLVVYSSINSATEHAGAFLFGALMFVVGTAVWWLNRKQKP